jgi:hypothetical protein
LREFILGTGDSKGSRYQILMIMADFGVK